MLNKRGHKSEFRHQSPGCPPYLIVSLLCFGPFQWGLSMKNLLQRSQTLSTVDTSKSVPLGLFNIQVYPKLIVYLHHKMEVLVQILSHGSGSMLALLPSVTWVLAAGGQMQPRCVGWQSRWHSETDSRPKVTHYKSLPGTFQPTVIVVKVL